MHKQKVIIRVDGNSNIGLGHIYRGIALAEMLKNDFDVCFITKPNSTITPITDVGFNYKLLPEITFLEEPNWLKQNIDNEAIIICDGYEFTEEYQQKIKNNNFKLVYVDDLAKGTQKADIVINHSPGIKEEDYKAEAYTQFALGLDYALIRQSFINFDRQNKKTNNNTETIFVSFGGADPKDFTYKVVEQLINIEGVRKINVVLGSAYKHNKLKDLSSDKINIYNNLAEKDIFEVMKNSDLAIVPASTTSIELAFIGVPILLGYFVDNQKIIYNGFVEKNTVYPLGDFNKKDFSELGNDIIKYKNKKELLNIINETKPNRNIIKLINNLC